jgi:hypothetical protein
MGPKFSLLDPLYLGWGGGGCNFLISNQFLKFFSPSDVPRGGVQVLFGHHKQWSTPLGHGLP